MNVLNMMFSTVNGGVEQVFLDYNQLLSDLGHNTIALVHPFSPIKNQCKHATVKTLFSYGSHDRVAAFRLKSLIEKQSIDVVITHTRRAAALAHQTKTSCTKIAVCHDPQLFPLLNTTSDAIITITEAMRLNALQQYPTQKKVITVSNMTHLQSTQAFSPSKPADVPIIGAMARFCHEKGLHVLIDALAKLKAKNVVFKAQIAGDGKLKKDYLKQIAQLGLQNEVQLLGWVDDRSSFYRNLSVFCLPSLSESFGLVVLEGMRYSVPMVLTSASGPCEIIGDSGGALFAKPNDADSLAQQLMALLQNHDQGQRMAQKAFLRLHDFGAPAIAVQLQNALTYIVNEP